MKVASLSRPAISARQAAPSRLEPSDGAGQYVLFEAPDDVAAARLLVRAASTGAFSQGPGRAYRAPGAPQ